MRDRKLVPCNEYVRGEMNLVPAAPNRTGPKRIFDADAEYLNDTRTRQTQTRKYFFNKSNVRVLIDKINEYVKFKCKKKKKSPVAK